MNSYIRFRLALTEEEPIIKPYEEARWAELPDAKKRAGRASLALFENPPERWVLLLGSLTPAEWARTFATRKWASCHLTKTSRSMPGTGRHPVAHITSLREREGWK